MIDSEGDSDFDIPKEKVRTLTKDIDFLNELEQFVDDAWPIVRGSEFFEITFTEGFAALRDHLPQFKGPLDVKIEGEIK